MEAVLFYACVFLGTTALAYATHKYIRSYIVASIVVGIVVPGLLIGSASLYRGYVDAWSDIAAVILGSFAFLTALAVGIPFVIRRRQDKAGEHGA